MTQKEILHILRNPFGYTENELEVARLQGADLIEKLHSDELEKEPRIVQTMNPMSKRWVKINRDKGTITPKKSEGQWKNVHVITKSRTS